MMRVPVKSRGCQALLALATPPPLQALSQGWATAGSRATVGLPPWQTVTPILPCKLCPSGFLPFRLLECCQAGWGAALKHVPCATLTLQPPLRCLEGRASLGRPSTQLPPCWAAGSPAHATWSGWFPAASDNEGWLPTRWHHESWFPPALHPAPGQGTGCQETALPVCHPAPQAPTSGP